MAAMTDRDYVRTYNNNRELLSGAYLTAYDALFQVGPLTAAELDAQLSWLNRGDHHYYIAKLEEQGLLVRSATRRCRITGLIAPTWDLAA